ncbi:MAG TPA: SUMF1/EgtB/PvdO family nonheme iron enzyme [Burkholderiaceae bacterium]|nr:SUMF1/EgtB/PvdO family nonheme iron enzyme [Burkholderiaceae bacterium]HMX10201.1 SUMF1/EgtB/PvdO family nonheme iron enzyme [Burkholderiaceae bacterium]HNB43351.1 SUMF1/EgtB/PvdO family nonheme iron enzyme [Burkholderiaceae bacterium]HNG79317.1 SUMF1/EgtB/PvdO family nonheme iron enzyme [Burkholderiaceae bacterium]
MRIFLASSKELEEHRREFKQAIGLLNELDLWRLQRGVTFQVVNWEDSVDAMSATRSQDEYNRALVECDVFVVLYRSKVGKYTAEEFEKAVERFKATGRPLIYTYFHQDSVNLADLSLDDFTSLKGFQARLKAAGHFETPYANKEALCGEFGRQLELLFQDGRLVPKRRVDGTPTVPNGPSPDRQRELDYLGNLVHRLLGAVEQLWVPLQAEQTRARSLARTRGAGVTLIRGEMSLRRRAAVEEAAPAGVEPDERFDDVLDAYRALPQRQGLRRLAVLGAPGAGKSFSLQRIAHEYATQALADAARPLPLPLLVQLGHWTEADEPLADFIERHLAEVCPGLQPGDLKRLRDAGRAVLLLDGLNEIPPGQRADDPARRRPGKLAQVRQESDDRRYVGVVVSCREGDFAADCRLPFDELRLAPLQPWQIHDAIGRAMLQHADGDEAEAARLTDGLFWRLVGNGDAREHWREWNASGATMEGFWELSSEGPLTGDSRIEWRFFLRSQLLSDERNLLRLAGNPYLLTLLMAIFTEEGVLPSNRAELFDTCLSTLYHREAEARRARGDASIPPEAGWRAALVQLAGRLQQVDGGMVEQPDGVRTSLSRADWPAVLTDEWLAFSVDASVLQRLGRESLRFTHQLLQEALAARVLIDAAQNDTRPASDFWPRERWWQRSGWEVAAEIAAEAVEADVASQVQLIDWLAVDHPGVAATIWRRLGHPILPNELRARTKAKWLSRMTDSEAEPNGLARAAIGSWISAQDLDDRPGTGLRSDGLPDIAWVLIDDSRPFIYQHWEHPPLPPYAIARYPVTNRQWQAFVDDNGYQNDRWWSGFEHRPQPKSPNWSDPTAPRETINWFEAMAFCHWLSFRMGQLVCLPTEWQWERAVRGVEGRQYPWGMDWDSSKANTGNLVGKTTLVGIYPNGTTLDEGKNSTGILDLAGNVWEWCLNDYDRPDRLYPQSEAVVRGGSWSGSAESCRATYRIRIDPVDRNEYLGLRLVVAYPFRVMNPEPGT